MAYRKSAFSGRSLENVLVRVMLWRSKFSHLDQWESCLPLACLLESYHWFDDIHSDSHSARALIFSGRKYGSSGREQTPGRSTYNVQLEAKHSFFFPIGKAGDPRSSSPFEHSFETFPSNTGHAPRDRIKRLLHSNVDRTRNELKVNSFICIFLTIQLHRAIKPFLWSAFCILEKANSQDLAKHTKKFSCGLLKGLAGAYEKFFRVRGEDD